MIKINYKLIYIFLIFIVLSLFSYRDFLWTYRSMVEDYFHTTTIKIKLFII